jgi:hypothetical protein
MGVFGVGRPAAVCFFNLGRVAVVRLQNGSQGGFSLMTSSLFIEE